MALERLPELGSKVVDLSVKLDRPKAAATETLANLMQPLYRAGELTDVVLLVAGRRHLAHRVVLASRSQAFRDYFSQSASNLGGQLEIALPDIEHSEAVEIMLSHLYQLDDKEFWERKIQETMGRQSVQQVMREALLLAERFQLQDLTNKMGLWLSKGLSTDNVVERLSICSQFDLTELSDKIVEQLVCSRDALAKVANNPEIMTHPKIMQVMLQGVAVPRGPEQERNKRPRRA